MQPTMIEPLDRLTARAKAAWAEMEMRHASNRHKDEIASQQKNSALLRGMSDILGLEATDADTFDLELGEALIDGLVFTALRAGFTQRWAFGVRLPCSECKLPDAFHAVFSLAHLGGVLQNTERVCDLCAHGFLREIER